eukprot:397380-Rhodomonas_salina.2
MPQAVPWQGIPSHACRQRSQAAIRLHSAHHWYQRHTPTPFLALRPSLFPLRRSPLDPTRIPSLPLRLLPPFTLFDSPFTLFDATLPPSLRLGLPPSLFRVCSLPQRSSPQALSPHSSTRPSLSDCLPPAPPFDLTLPLWLSHSTLFRVDSHSSLFRRHHPLSPPTSTSCLPVGLSLHPLRRNRSFPTLALPFRLSLRVTLSVTRLSPSESPFLHLKLSPPSSESTRPSLSGSDSLSPASALFAPSSTRLVTLLRLLLLHSHWPHGTSSLPQVHLLQVALSLHPLQASTRTPLRLSLSDFLPPLLFT